MNPEKNESQFPQKYTKIDSYSQPSLIIFTKGADIFGHDWINACLWVKDKMSHFGVHIKCNLQKVILYTLKAC